MWWSKSTGWRKGHLGEFLSRASTDLGNQEPFSLLGSSSPMPFSWELVISGNLGAAEVLRAHQLNCSRGSLGKNSAADNKSRKLFLPWDDLPEMTLVFSKTNTNILITPMDMDAVIQKDKALLKGYFWHTWSADGKKQYTICLHYVNRQYGVEINSQNHRGKYAATLHWTYTYPYL